ncbi:hypothetical protein [Mycolicibacterium sp. 120270]|uniref:hypothetical protein n=1 Tax=Mycolicibacterium sp. 120270 TaxID=3090600 RepID=UPI00299E7F93|nr:hypothetical protein [Mycolicibacterium sp. 120270]MDX1884507.1 hypothetical protein [Mycolicibacterium sp. 120270]
MSSSPQPTFTAPQANLVLYGALDDVLTTALRDGDADTAALVNRYLPGSVQYPGWSRQLRELFGPVQQSDDLTIAETVAAALNGVLANGRENLTVPDLANLIYAVGALAHIPAADLDGNADLFRDVLSLAVDDAFIEERIERANAFLFDEGGLYYALSGWDAWTGVIQTAAANDWIMKVIAEVPQCSTAVVTVQGLECVIIDAEITSNIITFDDLVDVIDPRNWPYAYPAFFCEMYPSTSRAPKDKWWNVRETVGFCQYFDDGGLGLTQRLRFLKSEQSKTDFRLDFDLSEDQTDCTGKVLVDRGFVNATCTREDGDTSRGGVRLTTKKVAHIKGINPYGQAFWLCKMGYGWIAAHLFFGKKGEPPPGWVNWKDAPLIGEPDNDPPDNEKDDGSGGGAGLSGGAGAGVGGGAGAGAAGQVNAGAAPPADDKLAVATKTAKRLADVADYLTKSNLDLTKKWLDGGLNFGDLAKFGSEVGARLASEPWLWLHEITTGTKPSEPPGGTP